jgi:hypothetical protein
MAKYPDRGIRAVVAAVMAALRDEDLPVLVRAVVVFVRYWWS